MLCLDIGGRRRAFAVAEAFRAAGSACHLCQERHVIKTSRFAVCCACAVSLALANSSGLAQIIEQSGFHSNAPTPLRRLSQWRLRGKPADPKAIQSGETNAVAEVGSVELPPAFAGRWSDAIRHLIAEDYLRPAPPLRLASRGEFALESQDASAPKDAPAAALATPPDPNSNRPAADPATPKKESLFSLDYVKLVGSDVKEVFTAPTQWGAKDWLMFGGVAGAVGLTYVFDEDIRKIVQRNRNDTVEHTFDTIEPLGDRYSFGVLAAFYVGGELFKSPKAKAVGMDGLSASIIASGLITSPLKYVVGRSRPSRNEGSDSFHPFSNNLSFPSGHTTQAFAVASVIAAHYDSIWIKAASYGLASMVGYARLNNDAHWASDVVAGAAIGTFVGHVVVHFNQKHRHVALTPILGAHLQGVQLIWSF